MKIPSDDAEQLSQILDFRNDEQTISINHTMRDMLRLLADLGVSAKEENAALVTLNEQAQKDARFTKIQTFVALLYLPASLIAVSEFQKPKTVPGVDVISTNSLQL